MRKVCIVTGTRAEYGLLKPVIDKIHKDAELELQLLVTGMHLSTEFGLTYKEIEKDGYPILKKVEMIVSSDTPSAIVKSMGLEMIGMADALMELEPDIMVLLGDRYEALVAAAGAMIFRIPIAHIHGGEKTEGVIDEAIRHSITKMSMLHFTATSVYAKRVIQLGERPEKVFCVGSLGVENIKSVQLLKKKDLETAIGFEIGRGTVLVTYHPVTLENNSAEKQFEELLSVIEKRKMRVIFTKANADMDGRIINSMIDEYVRMHGRDSICFVSMGMIRYLSSLQYVDMVIGNSSSGIIEVPSFGIPTVDIGDRQKGRLAAKSVIHCKPNRESIDAAIEIAISDDFRKSIAGVENPYEGNNPSRTIVSEIKRYLEGNEGVKKEFYDI